MFTKGIAIAASVAIALSLNAEISPRRAVDVDLDYLSSSASTHWTAGYLPGYSPSFGGAKPEVWMFDRTGKLTIPKTELWFPEASYVKVRDATADHSGNLYASLEVWLGGTETGAICRVAPGGKPILAIKTDEFLATSLAVTDKGEIWAFVVPLSLQTARTTKTEYNTLWRFDGSGHRLKQLLPRSTFGADLIPTLAFGDIGAPHLWATGARLDVYSASASRWIEYDLNTTQRVVDVTVERPAAPNGTKAAMFELAATEPDNQVYAFFFYTRYADAAHRGAIYRLDKTSARWVKVYERTPPAEFDGLFGADGGDLVLRAGQNTFGWFPIGTARER